jgi:Flp pilus assembly CpaE family ATPase
MLSPRPEFCSDECAASHRDDILNRFIGESGAAGRAAVDAPPSAANSGPAVAAAPESVAEAGHCAIEQLRGLISVIPCQGGAGASTVAMHLARAVARRIGGRALLIDFDFHSGSTAFRLGISPQRTLQDLLAGRAIAAEDLERAATRCGQIDVLSPAVSAAPLVDERQLLPLIRLAAATYAVVIVDHADSINPYDIPIVDASEAIYLVCTPELASIHLARRKKQQLEQLLGSREEVASRLRLIVNRASSWGSLGAEDVREIVGAPVECCLANDYEAVREAMWNGGFVADDSALAAEYEALAGTIGVTAAR